MPDPAGSPQWVDAILLALGSSGVTHLIDRFALRRKDLADAAKTEADGEVTVAKAWQEHAADLRSEMEQQRLRLDELWRQREECHHNIAQQNIELAALRFEVTQLRTAMKQANGKAPGDEA